MAGCGGGTSAPQPSAAATVAFPATPAGQQARWLFGAVTHGPIPVSQLDVHFDRPFLAAIPPAQLNADLAGVSSLRLDSVITSQPTALGPAGHRERDGQAAGQSRRRPAGPDQRPAAAASRCIGPARPGELGRSRPAAPVGGAAGPVPGRRGERRPGPGHPRPRCQHARPARLGVQALRAGRPGQGHRRPPGQLGPAADRHQRRQEPAVRGAPERSRRHQDHGLASGRRHDLDQRQHRRQHADRAARPARGGGRDAVGRDGRSSAGRAVPHHPRAVRAEARRLAQARRPLPGARARPAGWPC